MDNLQTLVGNYLLFCKYQKRLDSKTIKACRIDLNQFLLQNTTDEITDFTPDLIEHYIASLHQNYSPKTVKRKIASIKAFFHYLEYKDILTVNPFRKIQVKFREPVILPKIIPLHTVEELLSAMYRQYAAAKSDSRRRNILRDIAVIELLFATGIRISELCSLKASDVNLYNQIILIYGKGAKERRFQIGNEEVLHILKQYRQEYQKEIDALGCFLSTMPAARCLIRPSAE